MKVGDYVRTKSGSIFKIVGGNEDNWDLDISFGYLETFEEEWLELYRYNDNHSFFNDKNIIKSSPNIIDLIEENDIVNHSRVVCIGVSTDLNGIHKYLVLENGSNCANGNIKSILTKEQFENCMYKVGD